MDKTFLDSYTLWIVDAYPQRTIHYPLFRTSSNHS